MYCCRHNHYQALEHGLQRCLRHHGHYRGLKSLTPFQYPTHHMK